MTFHLHVTKDAKAVLITQRLCVRLGLSAAMRTPKTNPLKTAMPGKQNSPPPRSLNIQNTHVRVHLQLQGNLATSPWRTAPGLVLIGVLAGVIGHGADRRFDLLLDRRFSDKRLLDRRFDMLLDGVLLLEAA